MRLWLRDHLTLVLAGLAAAIFLVSLFSGPSAIGADAVWAALSGGGSEAARLIVFEIRAPRILAAFLVGAALALAGAALQALLRNPLAEPGLLGISASASFAAVMALYWGWAVVVPWALPGAAMAGAGLAILALSLFAAAGASQAALLLAGAGLASFATALTALFMSAAANPFSLSDMINWLMGSVENRSLTDIAFAAPFLGLGALCIFWRGRDLSALALGEETAFSLGVDIRHSRLVLILGAGLLAGAASALAGAIGFVGLAAPLMVRFWGRTDPARTLAPAALLGGAGLMGTDSLIRLLPFAQELRLGVAAALLGAPFFVAIIAGRWRNGEAAS